MRASPTAPPRGHPRANQWNTWARDFETHVCDIASTDREGVLRTAVQSLQLPLPAPRLLDLGCGRGTFLREHGGAFESCVGVDFSEEMLRLAAARCHRLRNISFVRSDVRRFRLASPPLATLTACFNVATSPLASHRRDIWNTVADCTADHGHALLVVPSFESAQAVQEAAAARQLRIARRLLPGGIASIDGVRQRFFRSQELANEIEPHGLACVAILKVWYPWGEEGLDGRRLRGVEHPWDWLALARRLPRLSRHGRANRK